LLGRRQARDETHTFVAEGVRLAEEGLAAGCHASLVLFSEAISERGMAVVEGFTRAGAEVEQVSSSLLDSLSATETSQGLLAVLPWVDLPIPDTLDLALVVDQVRDPGNLGALLRSAAAAGTQAVFLTPGTTDPYSPKVVRAGMGAHFRLALQSRTWPEIQTICQPRLKLYLAEAETGTPCWQLDLRQPVALIVGGEAEGATSLAHQAADGLISIPMPGKSESLNAAIAASILLFEIVRQRFNS